jgi:hypothetical protein
MYPYNNMMTLSYSKPIYPRVGSTRVYSRVFKGDVLDRSIQMYRMWFLFLRLGLDCEDNKIPIIDHVNNKKIKVGVDKEFYKKWDLDRVRTDTFDKWWSDKKHLFIESEPTIVDEIDGDEDFVYIKVDKRQKLEDVIRGMKKILKPNKSFTSEFGIKTQHKYISTHIKYNIFIMKHLGYTRIQISDLLSSGYKYYQVRIPKDESSIRRSLRSSEKVLLSVCKGVF